MTGTPPVRTPLIPVLFPLISLSHLASVLQGRRQSDMQLIGHISATTQERALGLPSLLPVGSLLAVLGQQPPPAKGDDEGEEVEGAQRAGDAGQDHGAPVLTLELHAPGP